METFLYIRAIRYFAAAAGDIQVLCLATSLSVCHNLSYEFT